MNDEVRNGSFCGVIDDIEGPTTARTSTYEMLINA